ncbi:HAD-like protein [Serendipita vermifera]|nr:HAD-like protein [Serendipita vermifera]
MAALVTRKALKLSPRTIQTISSSFNVPSRSTPTSGISLLNFSRRSFASRRDENGSQRSQGSSNSESSQNTSLPHSENSFQSTTSTSSANESAPTRKRQAFASLDFSPAEEGSEGKDNKQSLITDGSSGSDALAAAEGRKHRTGAKSAKDSLSSIERKRRRMGWLGAFGLVGGLLGSWVWLGWSDEPSEDGRTGIFAWIARSNRNTLKMLDLFDKPIWDKLLPEPLPPGYQRPYTLLLSIDDLLVASTWDRQNGWRTAKRPGVDYFLGYLSQFYEIVIFTTQSSQTAIPIIEQLDPYNFHILYHLFRESTRTYKGHVVKDLSYLNRDLSKVIAIDTVPDRYMLHPENVIILPKWKPGKKGRGEAGEGDLGLIGLIPFLESIGIFNPPDVRPILKAYEGKDIASEYAKIEAANKQRFIEDWEKKNQGASGLAKGGWTLGRLTGSAPAPPKIPQTWLESRRAIAQQLYQEELDFLEKNKAELDRQKAQAQEEGMKAMMEGGMFGVLSRMGIGSTPPPNGMTEPGTAAVATGTSSGSSGVKNA